MWQRFGEIWLITLVLVPVGLIVASGLARWRGGSARAWRMSLAEVGMVVLTYPWAAMILTSAVPQPNMKFRYLVPLSDLFYQVTHWSPAQLTVQIGGNLAVLAGLGALAPLRFAALARPWRLLALGAAVSLTLELLQHFLTTGRVFSVDDVLVNALGCLLGGLVTRKFWATTSPQQPHGRQEVVGEERRQSC